jgi:hypothetical protein
MGINDTGQIIANGLFHSGQPDFFEHAILLTPVQVPDPSVLWPISLLLMALHRTVARPSR